MENKFNQTRGKPRIISVDKVNTKFIFKNPRQVSKKKDKTNTITEDKFNGNVNIPIRNNKVDVINNYESINNLSENKASTKVKHSKTTFIPIINDQKKQTNSAKENNIVEKLHSNVMSPLLRRNSKIEKRMVDAKLDKPYYNSIKCTIQKIKSIEKEEIVKDVKSLPAVLQKNIAKKVSISCNFPPTEKVYSDLVNLSIDEKDFYMTKTRKPKKWISNPTSYTSANSVNEVSPLHLSDSSCRTSIY